MTAAAPPTPRGEEIKEPTAAQRRAIEALPGPVFVIAGPGAGKTHCLTERIAWVIDKHGAPPERICAVTFTNRAAEEIVDRLRERLGPVASDITTGTLHSLALRVLRQHAADVRLAPGFAVADEDYQIALLRRFVPLKRCRWLLTDFGRRRFGRHTLDHRDEQIYQKYREELSRRGMVDFDDLIAMTAELFRARPDIARSIAAKWDWILVDEFQDLNRDEYSIVATLASAHRRIFAVGDDEQAIFGFKGSDASVIGRFLNDFPDAGKPIVLEVNHRCSRAIFEAARRILAANPSLFDKKLEAKRECPDAVRAEHFADDEEEAQWLVAQLRAHRAAGHHWGDSALLYRKHDVGTRLETRMIAAGIPCRLARGHALGDDEVIKFIVSALGIIRTPGDDVKKDQFARLVIRQDLYDDLKDLQRREKLVDIVKAAEVYGRSTVNADSDRSKAWRLYTQIRNLRALGAQHRTLSTLIDDLLAQRIERYENALEKRADQLTDPASLPAAVALATSLATAVDTRSPIVVRVAGGHGIPLWTMLNAAGLAPSLARDEESIPGGVLAIDARVTADLPFTLFKALQIHASRAFAFAGRDYVTFDLETTDKDVRHSAIVEIAAVRVRGGRVVDRFQSLVHTRERMTAGAIAAHGITEAQLADAPTFADVWPGFRQFVGDDIVVGHNVLMFDAPVLYRHAKHLPDAGTLRYLDTLPLVRSLLRGRADLKTVATSLGVTERRFHRALDDAEMLADVFEKLQEVKLARARKAAQVQLLDDLGVALAISPRIGWTDEHDLLMRLATWRTLGTRGRALDQYAAVRERRELEDAPAPEEIVARLGGESMVERAKTFPDATVRYPEAVERLRTLVAASVGDTLSDQIDAFLERVALSKSDGAVAERDRVNLLTLHATKGLEFHTVFVIGIEDAQMLGAPNAPSREEEIVETRRLLYVGMTRARDRLLLTTVERRAGEPGGGSTLLKEMGLATGIIS